MRGRIPVAPQRRQVLARRISLVAIEAVARVVRMQRPHLPVTGHLGDDGRGGDGRTTTIPSHDSLLGHRELRHLESIDEHEVGRGDESQHGPAHGVERGAMDVDPIDVGRLGRGDCPGPRADDSLVQALATRRREELGIPEAGNGPIRLEDDGGRRDRTGEASAPDLVDARDPRVSTAPQRVLKRAPGARAPRGCGGWHRIEGLPRRGAYVRRRSRKRAALPRSLRR